METRRLRARLGLMSIGALMMDPQFVRRAAQDRGDEVDSADSESGHASPGDDPPTLRARWHTGWDRWRTRLTREKP
jgi:hypothetical protein